MRRTCHEAFLNSPERLNTIRVDSKVVHDTDTGHAKSDESLWLRFTLDTVGKIDWPRDRHGRTAFPEGFDALAVKRGSPLHPPGRDVRCIVSVGMLTEGWDCNTVTHIVGLRPFMSQLLCEQVVGRGLRRRTYDVGDDGLMTEEVAKVFGVPFRVVPFKANAAAPAPPVAKRYHVQALPGRAALEIRYPREVEMKASRPNNAGRHSLSGPGRLERVDLNPYRAGSRMQSLVFQMAAALTKSYVESGQCEAPAHALFPQTAAIAQRYVDDKVVPVKPTEKVDAFLSPYYGWAIERLTAARAPRLTWTTGPARTCAKFWTRVSPGLARLLRHRLLDRLDRHLRAERDHPLALGHADGVGAHGGDDGRDVVVAVQAFHLLVDAELARFERLDIGVPHRLAGGRREHDRAGRQAGPPIPLRPGNPPCRQGIGWDNQGSVNQR